MMLVGIALIVDVGFAETITANKTIPMSTITQIRPECTLSNDARIARANRILVGLRSAGDTSIDDFLLFIDDELHKDPAKAAATHPEFERGSRDHTMAIERSMGVMYLERLAPSVPGLVVEGERYRRLDLSKLAVLLMSGWVHVNRSLYGVDHRLADPMAAGSSQS